MKRYNSKDRKNNNNSDSSSDSASQIIYMFVANITKKKKL